MPRRVNPATRASDYFGEMRKYGKSEAKPPQWRMLQSEETQREIEAAVCSGTLKAMLDVELIVR